MERIAKNINVFGVNIGIIPSEYYVTVNRCIDETEDVYLTKILIGGGTFISRLSIPGKTASEIIFEFDNKLRQEFHNGNKVLPFKIKESDTFDDSIINWDSADEHSVITYRQYILFSHVNSKFINKSTFNGASEPRSKYFIELKDGVKEIKEKSFIVTLLPEEYEHCRKYVQKYESIKNDFGVHSVEFHDFLAKNKRTRYFFENKYLNEDE